MEELGRSQKRKKLAAKEQRNLCFYCQIRMTSLDDMTWEHLVPRSHGGTDKASNMRIAHGECNVMVGNLNVGLKLALHDVGVKLGSDAFFQTCTELVNLAPGTLALAGIKRRAKRLSKNEQKRVPPEIIRVFERNLLLAASQSLTAPMGSLLVH